VIVRTETGGAIGVVATNDHDRPPRKFSAGRVCVEYGCGASLSIYNDGSYCSLHHLCRVPRLRGKKIA
jgi:hypothetical protein